MLALGLARDLLRNVGVESPVAVFSLSVITGSGVQSAGSGLRANRSDNNRSTPQFLWQATTNRDKVNKKTPSKPYPATQQINEFKAAILSLCDSLDQEIYPLSQETSERATYAKMLARRGRGRVPKKEQADLVFHLKGQGKTVSEIVKETGIPETTVRRHYGPIKK